MRPKVRFFTPTAALLRRITIYGTLLFLIIIQTSPFIDIRRAVPGLVLVLPPQ